MKHGKSAPHDGTAPGLSSDQGPDGRPQEEPKGGGGGEFQKGSQKRHQQPPPARASRQVGRSVLRTDFPYIHSLPTRWSDNDIYGHVNNVTYYAYFDTAVNRYLIEQCGLDMHEGPVIGLVAETGCRFFAPIAFPDRLAIGIRVARLGTSSVIYELGVFKENMPAAIAMGKFVHVYVDRHNRRPVTLPDPMRAGLRPLLHDVSGLQ